MNTLSNSSTSSSTDYKIIDVSMIDNETLWYEWFLTAGDPNTPPKTLNRLANNAHPCVRQRVGQNRNTLPETLERLANDKDVIVRYYVAGNPNTPQYLKDYLKFKEYFYCYEQL